jgi:hypothetical protein
MQQTLSHPAHKSSLRSLIETIARAFTAKQNVRPVEEERFLTDQMEREFADREFKRWHN